MAQSFCVSIVLWLVVSNQDESTHKRPMTFELVLAFPEARRTCRSPLRFHSNTVSLRVLRQVNGQTEPLFDLAAHANGQHHHHQHTLDTDSVQEGRNQTLLSLAKFATTPCRLAWPSQTPGVPSLKMLASSKHCGIMHSAQQQQWATNQPCWEFRPSPKSSATPSLRTMSRLDS